MAATNHGGLEAISKPVSNQMERKTTYDASNKVTAVFLKPRVCAILQRCVVKQFETKELDVRREILYETYADN